MQKVEAFEAVVQEFKQMTYEDSQNRSKLFRRFEVLLLNYLDNGKYYVERMNRVSFSPYDALNEFGSEWYEEMEFNESEWKKQWTIGYTEALNVMKDTIEEVELLDSIDNGAMKEKPEKDCSTVFIVHGHDDASKYEVARFVETIGFRSTILHEQASSGSTIIEKIEQHTDVGFAIVLYTQCDVGAAKSDQDNLQPRARQNVVFEHGFLIGKIGRKNVVALVKGNVEKPNDISGVVYISLDESQGWKLSLVREMRASGYDIDMNKVS
ncbi:MULTISPECIES: TIR domain-containing protein [unclassified Psychrobacter]|uniref:TIR domain-containing protein n=1 Tax=unclassified Psychrobacter TaxID=196806 RepID=UPI0019196AA4|nr:nucleotide-binding protein [Psychrobacter sp. NC44]